MKALILSVRHEHAYNILNGDKTLELRKSVPKCFKGWVYVYVTKGKPLLTYVINEWCLTKYGTKMSPNGKVFTANGTIPFRFWFDEYEKIIFDYMNDLKSNGEVLDTGSYEYYITLGQLKDLCLTYEELIDYGKGNDLYAWHIKDLDIFPKPMQLSEFYKTDSKYIQDYERLVLDYRNKIIKSESKLKKLPITKAPQSYMYAWVKEALK